MTTTFYNHWQDVPEGAWRWPNFSPAELNASINRFSGWRDGEDRLEAGSLMDGWLAGGVWPRLKAVAHAVAARRS